jgi:type I restriction enzyme, R subunit
VFGKGNQFAKKITYRVSGASPADLIKEFQTAYNPRIAVTVDMIATGTDIRPLEVVMFLRDVKSELYFEQMKGRDVRTVLPTDLRQVTPDAHAKDRFVLIDAVGVTESVKTVSQPLERKRTIAFDKLLEQVAAGERSDDALLRSPDGSRRWPAGCRRRIRPKWSGSRARICMACRGGCSRLPTRT